MQIEFEVNAQGKYCFESDDEINITDEQHNSIKSVVEFIQTFDDRKIEIHCVFDPVLGGIRLHILYLGKIHIYGYSGDDDEILILSYVQQLAECYPYAACRQEKQEELKRLLTTA